MADRSRRWAVLLTGLAILAMVLLAAGLSNLELLPGHLPARVREPSETDAEQPPSLASELADVILVILGMLALLFVALFIFYLLFSANAKKRLLITLGLLLSLLILYLVSNARPRTLEQGQLAPTLAAADLTPTLGTALPPGMEPATIDLVVRPPAWLVWLGAVALALLTVGAVAGIAWLFWSQGRRASTPLEQLARQAERALGALEGGADINDTIMRCYLEMSQVLKQERGIIRHEAMTPREFARGLRAAGLPQEPVAQLTRLFEKARYGAGIPDEGEEQQAIICLAAIVEKCRSMP